MSSLADLSFQSGSAFTFVEEIGSGGMGIVYLAKKHCEGVNDLVVLKTIRTITNRQVEALKAEANIAAALRHENIVRTYGMEAIPFENLPEDFQKKISTLKKGFGKSGDKKRIEAGTRGMELLTDLRMGRSQAITDLEEQHFLASETSYQGKRLYLVVLEYIEGWDLRAIHGNHIKAGLLLPIELNAFIISRICRALEYAHEYIVHRDISPENILVSDQGVTKLTDFGIAVAADQDIFGLAGKIQYMAPEQVQNDQIDNRSDIFSLGLVAYYLLTGVNLLSVPMRLTFEKQAVYYEKILKKEMLPPHKVCLDVPEEYSGIIMKMLEIDPDMRYQTIEQVGSDIEKKCLYGEGFGPTNNSLAAYMKIFESGFKIYTKQDLQQLTFLKNVEKKYRLKRKIGKGLYSDKGRQLIITRHKERGLEKESSFDF